MNCFETQLLNLTWALVLQFLKGAKIILDFLWSGLNSSFGTALLAAAGGAFAGALGAQRIAEGSRRREDLLKELRNTNAATVLAATTCNTALAVKKQHVQSWYEKFRRERAALEVFLEQRKTGQIQANTPFDFQADLTIFGAPEVPVETLKHLIFHEISAHGRA